jgi:RNA polymerase sigma factor (sigma-70 family)
MSDLSTVLGHLHRVAAGTDERTDAQLLECFVGLREEAAFAALLHRHGPMVWGVCRRVLRNDADAEDAFQATFLILAGKAATILDHAAVANWLYGVAHNTARKALAQDRRRRALEREWVEERQFKDSAIGSPLQPFLDGELSRLPDKYRAPMVLCYLEGRPLSEASRQLGCPLGTVASRLARGRALLARRLARHGLALLGVALARARDKAWAGVPPGLARATLQAAAEFAAGSAAEVPARITALTEGVLRTMFLNRLKVAAALVFTAGVLLIAGGAITYQALGTGGPRDQGAPRPTAAVEKIGEVRLFEGHAGTVLRVAFSPDGRLAASSSMSNTVRLWEVATGKTLFTLEGHTERVDCVTFSPDGKHLLSAAWDGTVRLWDVASGKELKRFDTQGNPGQHVCNVVFLPGGKQFLWNAVDHEALQIWDVESGQMVKQFGEHPDHVAAVALSPDGKRVLEGNWDADLRLWDIETGQLVREFEGHTERVYCVAISPDGKRALSCSGAERPVIVWDLETGKELRRFEGHTEPVDFVAFSPDGRRALSCGQDKTVRLWEVGTGKELCVFDSHTDRVECVTFSPDDRHALSGSDDHTVRLWRLPK